jgi:hypothetical protein
MDTDVLLGIATVVLIFGGIPMIAVTVGIVFIHLRELQEPSRTADPARRTGNTATAVVGVLAGVLLWAAWISWGDFEYPTWAIVGCVITSVMVVVALGFLAHWRWSGPFTAALAGLFGFSTACAVQMGESDDTGLWGVGYMMIVIFGGVVLAALALGVMLVRTHGAARPTASSRSRSRPAPGR